MQDLDDYAPEPEVHAYLKDRHVSQSCPRKLPAIFELTSLSLAMEASESECEVQADAL